MLGLKTVYDIQSNQVCDLDSTGGVDFYDYLNECRKFITGNLSSMRDVKDSDKMVEMEKLIMLFVEKHKIMVKGYVSKDGILDIDLLISDIKDMILSAGILKSALVDPEVDEIQVNEKATIFVIRNGVSEPYRDKNNRLLQFMSNDEIIITLKRIIDDGSGNQPQFTEGLPILNAKTAKEQYRINATYSTINARDKPPYNYPVTTITLRKFKEVKLTFDSLIKGGSLTPKMARFLSLVGRTSAKYFCVGPTGSGKTTLLDIMMKADKPTEHGSKRIIAVQNPTEISFFDRDETGRNKWNVIHWEANSVDNSSPTNGTMANLISNAMRCTPDIILVGECRDPADFEQLFRALNIGECIRGTFHTNGVRQAVGRIAGDAGKATGSSRKEMLPQVAECIDLIVYQYKFNGGSRRIMEVGEILGADDNGNPIVNMIFEFEFDGGVVKGKNGIPEPTGKFVHKNKISKKMENLFYSAGIPREEILEFLEDSSQSKEE